MVSTRYLKEIFHISPVPILVLKAYPPHYEIVSANPAYYKSSGKDENELIGKNIFDVFPANPQGNDMKNLDKLRASFAKVIATKRPDFMERFRYDLLVRDLGVYQVKYWEPQNHPILDEEGNVEQIIHIVADVSDEAITKENLKASEDQFKELIHSLDVIVWEADPITLQNTYVSPQSKDILGYDQAEWYQNDFWIEKLHPDDKAWVVEYFSTKIQETQNYQVEYRIIKSDGSYIWVNDRVSFLKEPNQPIKLRGVLTDITKRKNAEEQVQENERKIRKILDHSLDIICTMDFQGRFREINAAVVKTWGYTPEELEDKYIFDFLHEEDKEASARELEEMVKGKKTTIFENRYITKDGRTVPMLWSVYLDENEQLIFCVGKDATFIKASEDQLKFNEQRFKSLVQHGRDFIAILDTKGINTYVSPTSEKITGWHSDQLVGYSAFTFIHEEDVDRVMANFKRLMDGESILTETFRILHKNGKYIWMETYAINMLENPVIKGIVINARDITEKKRYLEWHEYVNKATNNAIFDWDLVDNQMQWGGNMKMLFDPKDDIINYKYNDYAEIIHPDDRERMLTLLRTLLKDKSEQQLKSACRIVNAEGIYLDVEIDGYFIRDRLGYVIRMIGAIRDVSIQKTFENQLKFSNQRYQLVSQATSDVIWDWDLQTNSLYWGDGTDRLFGYENGSLAPHIRSWYSRIHPKDYKKITGELNEFIASGKNLWEGEYRFLRADGDYNYVYDRGYVVRDAQGKAIRLVGAIQNIQQEKMREVENNLKIEIGHIFTHEDSVEASLKETLKVISKIHDFAYAELWMTSLDDSYISLRAHYGKGKYIISEDHTQFSPNEGLPGIIWTQNQPKFIESIENDRDFVRKNLAKDNGFINIAGFPIPFNEQVKAVILFFYKKNHQLSQFSLYGQEILSYLGNELQRKKAEVELDHFFELSPDLMCITNLNGKYIKVNNAFENLLGFNKNELLTYNFLDLMHPDDVHIFSDLEQKVASGQIMNHESRMRNKSGSYLWLSWTGKPFPGDGLIFGVGKDISEKKIQEEALADSHEETLKILESIQDGFIAIDKDGTVSYWNNAAETIIQTTKEDILGNNIWEVFPAAKELKFYSEFLKVLEEGVSVRFEEYYAPLNIWLMVSAYPSETGITAYLKDITESKIASLKLIQFKKVIENSKDEIAIISTVNESIYLNPAFKDSFGYGSETVKQMGGPQKIFADEEQAAAVYSDLLAGRHWKGDVELIGSSKTMRSYYISAGPIYDDNGKLIAVFIIHTDISKRKETEGKLTSLYSNLQHQSKELDVYRDELDRFAQIASKNMNMPLKLISEKLLKIENNYADSMDEKFRTDLHFAISSSENMQYLISELLEYTLAERANIHNEKLDLELVLEEAKGMLRNRIHEKFATIDTSIFPIIKGNRSHFVKIFTTLLNTILDHYNERPQVRIQVDSDTTHWLFYVQTTGTMANPDELTNISQFLESPMAEMDVVQYMPLATVRKIIGKYKGEISLEGDTQKRSTFFFTITKKI